MLASFLVDEETKQWIEFEVELIDRDGTKAPPIQYTLTKDGWTYTLMLAGVAEKKAFYRLVTKRRLMG